MLVVTAHCFCGYGIAHMIARQTNHSAEQGSLAGLFSSLPRGLALSSSYDCSPDQSSVLSVRFQACCQVSRCACWGWVQPLAFGAEPPFAGGYGPSRDYCIAIIFRVVTAKTGI